MNEDQLPELATTATQRWTFWFWLIVILLAIGVAGYYFKFAKQAEDNHPQQESRGGKRGYGRGEHEDRPAVVSVETITSSDFPVYLNGLGTVTALRTVTVRPRVDGELTRIAFTEGQQVQAGDLLAEIDPRPFQIQLQQAEGQLLRDEALLKNAETDLNRYQTLLEQDSISAQQSKTQEAQVKQFKGTVAMDKALVNSAKLQLDYAQVRAPIAGRVGLRQLDQGNIVRANDANGIVVITELQPISVVFTLPEDKIQAVIQRWQKNQNLTVTAFDRAGKTKLALGKLKAIDNQIDASTGTLKFKAEFDNKELTLFANQFVNVQMHLETLQKATLVPSAAIQNDTQGAYVYVVKDKQVETRRVVVGPTNAERVVVTGNLAANEIVVVEGFDSLRDGGKVDVAKQDGQAIAAAPDLRPQGEGKPSKRERR